MVDKKKLTLDAMVMMAVEEIYVVDIDRAVYKVIKPKNYKAGKYRELNSKIYYKWEKNQQMRELVLDIAYGYDKEE